MTLSAQAVVRVGVADGDMRGNDHRVIQGAIEYLAMLGGGTVEIGPGEYTLGDSLHLRSGVHIRGTGAVLRQASATKSLLYSDAGFGETVFTPVDPTGFAVGRGVTLSAPHAGGYHTTVATIVDRQQNSFIINKECVTDYTVPRGAYAATIYPMISGIGVQGVTLTGLTLQGNRAETEFLNGCRGGGIYLYNCAHIRIADCTVDGYNGDGISWQKSAHVEVQRCVCRHNAGNGAHPGTGSEYTVMSDCVLSDNDQSGLFVCWRVKYGKFTNNTMRGNGSSGISIGHQDTDNLFAGNTIEDNRPAGIFFRRELEPMGAHRNRFTGNRIADNGSATAGCGVFINGITHDLEFVGNTVTYDSGKFASLPAYGFVLQPGVERVHVAETNWLNVAVDNQVVHDVAL